MLLTRSYLQLLCLTGLTGTDLWLTGLHLYLTGPPLKLTRLARPHLRLHRTLAHRHRASHRTLHSTVRLDRLRSRRRHGTATIRVVKLLPILRRLLPHLQLGVHLSKPRLATGRNLCRPRSNLETSTPAVIRNPVVDDRAIHHNRVVVYVRHPGNVDLRNRAVIEEVVPAPIATVVAITGVPEPVRNSAVEADVAAPVPAMEAIASTVEAPVAGGP